jgi:hypothetical protein
MIKRKKPIELFISYSHKDRKHLDKLRAHLRGLEYGHQVHCWWDGAIEVGKPWEAQIFEALRDADVVLLLLTANFIDSYYCMERELLLVREREKKGEIDLVPIWVESFDIESHWLGQLQVIKVNDKPVIQSRLGSAAWESVAKQIRLKVECMEGKRPVIQALNEVEEVVHSGDVRLKELSEPSQLPIANFPTVSEFWKAQSTVLKELGIVTVPGTLSKFAPMLMGPPYAKRMLHREFRRAIETNRRFGAQKRLTINACMSISAGQMVHQEARSGNRKRLLGLYESIVRNTIPVFVLPDYYEKELLPVFQESRGTGCFEASVTGRLFTLDNNYIRRFFARQGIDKILPAFVIDNLCRDAYALEVGGPNTKVQPFMKQSVRYLDGDIWVVAKLNGTERFFTAFVDITNAEERDEEMFRLRKETQGSRIIAVYDELHSIEQLLSYNDL